MTYTVLEIMYAATDVFADDVAHVIAHDDTALVTPFTVYMKSARDAMYHFTYHMTLTDAIRYRQANMNSRRDELGWARIDYSRAV